MTVNKQLQKYYTDYIYDYNKEIIKDDTGEINEFEVNFPYDPEEMRIFIEVFESIFPKANHKFDKYIKLLEGLNIMEKSEDFKDTDMFMDVFDYIREEALEELTNQISDYPQKIEEEKQYFDFIEYIGNLNAEIGFFGMNSEVIEKEDDTIHVRIEATNNTTIAMEFQRSELEDKYYNNELKKHILSSYENHITKFDIDEEFNSVYNSLDGAIRPSEFLSMISEDKKFFMYTIRDAIKKISY